ncbi:unnamed protein product [Phytomonas sp. EM1]|nr:unnamed protein product [Phytomonas sp. EM1]|eukprot:CCW61204.1 unnamed protein product [Phytomonas sp. isolate EM1]
MPSICANLNHVRPHYISDSVYTLGTLSCSVCGHPFPINSCARVQMSCEACGTLHRDTNATISHVPSVSFSHASALYAAARLFTQDTINALVSHVMCSLNVNANPTCGEGTAGETVDGSPVQGKMQVGITEIDNRVIEEALCEGCGEHRPCKTFARQTRSADEGQTIFFQCTVCKLEWQQNS